MTSGDQINLLLLRLARDTSHRGVQVECPELCICSSLPPVVAISAAKSFAELDSVSDMFGQIRENHTNAMHTTASVLNQPKKRPGKKTVVGDVPAAIERLTKTHTFLRCILEIADPSFCILSFEDSEKCLAAFLQRSESLLTRDRQGIATAYVATAKNRGVTIAVQDVVDSLRDPTAALSDKGLNDAAVLMMAQILRVTIVMKCNSSKGFVSFYPNPGLKYEASDHAVLIGWNDVESTHIIEDSSRIVDVRSRIFEASPELLLTMTATKLKKMTIDELRALASKVVINTPRAHFPTKATIIEAVVVAAEWHSERKSAQL